MSLDASGSFALLRRTARTNNDNCKYDGKGKCNSKANATAKANTGVLRFAQDDDYENRQWRGRQRHWQMRMQRNSGEDLVWEEVLDAKHDVDD